MSISAQQIFDFLKKKSIIKDHADLGDQTADHADLGAPKADHADLGDRKADHADLGAPKADHADLGDRKADHTDLGEPKADHADFGDPKGGQRQDDRAIQDDLDASPRMNQRDNCSSGFHSESESLFSSGEEDFPYDSDNDPVFIPPTDMDDSDTDTSTKHGKSVKVTKTGSSHGKHADQIPVAETDTSSNHDDVQVTYIGSNPNKLLEGELEQSEIPESDGSVDSVTFPALTKNKDLGATLPTKLDQTGESSITVQPTTNKKCWYCVFCGRAQKRLPRHLLTQHADEESVMQFASCKNSKQKHALLTKMRNLGNHLHYVEVLKNGKGVMIVSHRPTQYGDNSQDSSVPCPECYGYFRKALLYRHVCPLACVGDKSTGSRVKKGQCLLPNQTGSTRFSEFYCSFRKGVVSTLAKTDSLLAKYAEVEFDKNGHDPDMHNYIRTKVRTVAKLLLEVRKVVGSPVSLTECISPDKYDAMVAATKRLAGYDEDTQEFCTPSIAKNCGMYVKKCALIYQSVCLQNLDSVGEQRALQLIKLIELTWNQRISHHALRTIKIASLLLVCCSLLVSIHD